MSNPENNTIPSEKPVSPEQEQTRDKSRQWMLKFLTETHDAALDTLSRLPNVIGRYIEGCWVNSKFSLQNSRILALTFSH